MSNKRRRIDYESSNSLSDDILCVVFEYLQYDQFNNIKLVNKSWSAIFEKAFNILVKINTLSIFNRYSFFKKLNISKQYLEGDPYRILKDNLVPLLNDYKKCKRLFNEQLGKEWTEDLDESLSVLAFLGNDPSSNKELKSFVGGSQRAPIYSQETADKINGLTYGIFVAELHMSEFQSILSTQSVYPPDGVLLFYAQNGNESLIIHEQTFEDTESTRNEDEQDFDKQSEGSTEKDNDEQDSDQESEEGLTQPFAKINYIVDKLFLDTRILERLTRSETDIKFKSDPSISAIIGRGDNWPEDCEAVAGGNKCFDVERTFELGQDEFLLLETHRSLSGEYPESYIYYIKENASQILDKALFR
ncbi:hypothetical protein AKO1_006722, partial [Acrasis kona]